MALGASQIFGGGGANAVASGTDFNATTYSALGTPIQAQTLGATASEITVSSALTSGRVYAVAVYIPASTTLTGLRWYQAVQGSYTGNNTNGVALYSVSPLGVLNMVTASTNTSSTWSAASVNTYGSTSFAGTYAASAGLYYASFLYNASAQTTPPSLGSTPALVNLGVNTFGVSSRFLTGYIAGTAFPASSAASSFTTTTVPFWIGVY